MLRRLRHGPRLQFLTLAVTVPLLALSAALAVVWSRQHRAAVEDGLLDTARAFAVAIEKELEISITALEALATSTNVDTGNLPSFAAEAQRVLPTQQWYTIFLADPDGRQLFNLEAPLPSLATRPYFQRVVATRQPQVSALVHGDISAGQHVAVAVPVERAGQLRYVLGAAIRPAVLSALLVRLPDPAHVAWIVDRNGTVIARSRDAETSVGTRAAPEYLAGIRRAEEGALRSVLLEGPDDYAAFTGVALADWTVGVSEPAAVLEAPLRRSLWTLALAAVAAAGVASGAAVIIGRRIARPIVSAAVSAEGLATGRPVAVLHSSIQEVKTLTSALRGSAALLERRERERAELDRHKDRLVARLRLVSETTGDLLTAARADRAPGAGIGRAPAGPARRAGGPHGGRGRESRQGRVPRRPVARAPDTAERHARLGTPAPFGAARRHGGPLRLDRGNGHSRGPSLAGVADLDFDVRSAPR